VTVWEILPDLFLGDYSDARNRERLLGYGITHIVNCSRELPCKFEGDFTYLRLGLDDPDPGFAARLPECCGFIDEGRRQGKVLVHCTMASSRSPAVILAYLCRVEGSLEDAAERLRRVVATGINEAFLVQLAAHLGRELTPAAVEALQDRLLSPRQR
jgi:hypothetical protein